MAHVIPTLSNASRAMYTHPPARRTVNPNRGEAANAVDFRTVLKDEAAPAVATPTSTVPATSPTATPGATVGTIGTVTPWSPSAVVNAPATPATTSKMAPTMESLFGANPWVSNAGGTGPNGDYGYNHCYFATPATAAKVAQMLGGTVVQADAITPYGPFKQNQPNLMVQMPNGKLINAGVVAGFYDHGYTQQAVDAMIASEKSDLG
ncbi:MAG: hypothetical protein ABI806_21740 [Candidatus Solibacter sp.]